MSSTWTDEELDQVRRRHAAGVAHYLREYVEEYQLDFRDIVLTELVAWEKNEAARFEEWGLRTAEVVAEWEEEVAVHADRVARAIGIGVREPVTP